MKCPLFGLVFAFVASAAIVTAQVSVTGQESKDKSASSQQITVSTSDRSVVPLMIESKQTQVDPNTTRTESTTRARLGDGSYFDWRSSVSTQKQIDPNHTETVQDVVEKDRQGGTRTVLSIKQETASTPTGEQTKSLQYRRDSSGGMILDRVGSTTTTKNSDGTSSTTSTEQVRDVNGNLHPVEQTQATTVLISPTKTQITTQIGEPDHIQGGFSVVARETATVNKTGNTTQTDRTIQRQNGNVWQEVGKSVTTETRQADGSIRRETVEEGQPLYARSTTPPIDVQPLVAQRKIVESEVRKPDGTVVMQRDVFRRNVNGDWQPVTFSTEMGVKTP
jgi:hypothetical protein